MIIGIDISKRSFDVSWVVEDKLHHQVFDYTDEGIADLLSKTSNEAHYVMEATGIYHTRLALRLHLAGRKISVVNPLIIKRFSQMSLSRVKSDKADALLIRSYGEQHTLSLWSPSTEEVLELQQAHSWLDDLIRERTRLFNHQEAHNFRASPSQFVKKQMSRQLHHLEKQIKECEQYLEVVVKKSFLSLYQRLQTIPSIGAKTAIELIIVTNGFSRFNDVKSLCSYIGVSPTTFRSGTSVKGKGRIAKMGQGRMRQLLYLCSWTAKSCNPSCKALNARLRAAGKPGKVIHIAIAHKLLRQAFAVATKGLPYSENYA